DTNNNLSLPGTGSQTAFDVLSDKFPPQQNGTSPIMFHVTTGTLDDTANKMVITDVFRAINNYPHVYSAYNPVGPNAKYVKNVSADKKYGYIPVLLSTPSADVTLAYSQRLYALTEPAQKAGIQVAAGGTIGGVLSSDTQ